MIIILTSFLAGILSVLAPCVLPMIPVLFGGGLVGDKRKPLRIIGSAMVCIFVFTYLLKISTTFVNIPTSTRSRISGMIIGLYGLVLLFPSARDRIMAFVSKYRKQDTVVEHKQGMRGDVLLGASLGPIFASCSPTYALLLGAVLPVSTGLAIAGIVAYMLGFGGFLYVLVVGGRQIIQKFYTVSDNDSRFKRILGMILLILGICIVTGYIKIIEANLLSCVSDTSVVEQSFLERWGVNDWIEKNTTSFTGAIEEELEVLDVAE